MLQQKSTIFIATDGSESNTHSGGSWVLSIPHGQLLAHGSNPDYGSMNKMHSHRSEAYAMLSVVLFLKKYSNFYSIPLKNKFKT